MNWGSAARPEGTKPEARKIESWVGLLGEGS